MTEPDASKIDLIQKLLLKAESTTPEEAEALTAKAAELMLRYNVDQALLNARSTSVKERIEQVNVPLSGIYAKAYMAMMNTIAHAYGDDVRTFFTPYGKSKIVFTIVGFESTVGQLKVLLASLQLQSVVALDTWWRAPDNVAAVLASPMEKFKARRTFLKAFGEGAASRIRVTRRDVVRDVTSSTPGAELVLRDRKTAVDQFMDEKYSDLKKSKAREKAGGFGASGAGYRAGKNANTGDKQVSNQRALNA